MSKNYVLYNPLAGNKRCGDEINRIEALIDGKIVYCDMTKPETYSDILPEMQKDDILIVCGGDGTLNRFINLPYDYSEKNEVYYFPMGSGNDFAHELGRKYGDKPFNITKYLKDLPEVTVNGKTHRFLNGIGYGIDGYCCEVGDKLRETANGSINYTAIAIKGLLFHYKPTNATVTVDGVKHRFNKVWLAPTMNGKFYGGGMMPTPNQDRTGVKLSVMVYHGLGKLKALMVFPSIFKGEHVKHKNNIAILEGKEITVEFDRPTPLQIDGETILGVSLYETKAHHHDTVNA